MCVLAVDEEAQGKNLRLRAGEIAGKDNKPSWTASAHDITDGIRRHWNNIGTILDTQTRRHADTQAYRHGFAYRNESSTYTIYRHA